MEHHTTTSRVEAERLLGIAEKLLGNKDFSGCRDFAILAQETEPLLEGSEQILAVAEVLLAAEKKRLKVNQPDWYSILQIHQRTDDVELIKKQYRRLALLLHPDKNKYAFADSAFRLVADSWAVLSDPAKKTAFDIEFGARFTKVDLVSMKKQQLNTPRKNARGANSNQKLPVRRSSRSSGGGGSDGAAGGGIKVNKKSSNVNSGSWLGNFWTACPYCYNLYEYPREYEECCLRCDNEKCKRTFTGTEVLSMPPVVPGREAYYCCWGFFPMGFSSGNASGFPKWMPPMFETAPEAAAEVAPPPPVETVRPIVDDYAAPAAPAVAVAVAAPAAQSTEKRKRGRPKKNL